MSILNSNMTKSKTVVKFGQKVHKRQGRLYKHTEGVRAPPEQIKVRDYISELETAETSLMAEQVDKGLKGSACANYI